jgi:DNA replication protein DnaC
MTMKTTTHVDDPLLAQARRLGLYGIAEHWEEYGDKPWLPRLLELEDKERQKLSLARRIRAARIGRFKPMADFDWHWPKSCDRDLIEELFTFSFLEEHANIVLVGGNGIGKTMIAKNLSHQAVLKGMSVRFLSASEMLIELTAQDNGAALERRFRKYAWSTLLTIDEVGYLSYNSRHADLFYEVISRRYEAEKPTIITTNKAFSEWNQMFPNASCVGTLVDRLVHKSEIVKLEGESYRLKEAKERQAQRTKGRRGRLRVAGRGTTPSMAPTHA